jgi:protein involved in polysaccharide export with SLBB domain
MDVINISPIYDKVWETVNLSGTVQHPGDYQWRPDLRVKEIIDQGGLLPTSDLRRAEIVRLSKDLSDRQIITVDLGALMQGDEKQNVPLQPQDQVRVYSEYKQAPKVSVDGEVVRPGSYEVMNGERLSDLLRRVGGMTAEGYAYGAVFKRKTVKSTESKNLQSFIAKMQSQVLTTAAGSAATAISTEEASFAKAELALNQSLLNNLKTMQEQAEGRVAVNITGNIDEWAGSKEDLILQDGDSLFIPKKPQEVMVIGEVYSPGAQIHTPESSVKDYLERTGGFTKNADFDQVFVVQANGFAYGADSPNVGDIEKAKLQPGDSIFVPQKLERYAAMRTTRDIVDIMFKTAVIIATITILF